MAANNKQLYMRLQSMVKQLHSDAKATDKLNKDRKSHYYIKEQALFSETLFPVSSTEFSHYVSYVDKQLNHLIALQNAGHKQLADSLLEQLEQQISAIIVALKSDPNRHKDSDYRLQINKRRYNQRQSDNRQHSQAKSVMMNAHQMHSKLVEYRGFESRLELMIREEEQKLKRSNGANQNALQQSIFALHQRLGRCRRAIADLERKIEDSEKRG
ncbi:primosomal replication protein PriC [Thalassotalea sp. HSM 43]|uniref:primosomal replication protein PriC n=1 Tax=Thalassotalea sp. HSM 43 TaxID=2552945 RepID=UPI001673F1A3|nr:primosomal replication protein PriC [Thalassotalea sp. HSM 43]